MGVSKTTCNRCSSTAYDEISHEQGTVYQKSVEFSLEFDGHGSSNIDSRLLLPDRVLAIGPTNVRFASSNTIKVTRSIFTRAFDHVGSSGRIPKPNITTIPPPNISPSKGLAAYHVPPVKISIYRVTRAYNLEEIDRSRATTDGHRLSKIGHSRMICDNRGLCCRYILCHHIFFMTVPIVDQTIATARNPKCHSK